MTVPTIWRSCPDCLGQGVRSMNAPSYWNQREYPCSHCENGLVPFRLETVSDVMEAIDEEGWQAVRDAYRGAGYSEAETYRALADFEPPVFQAAE